MFGEEKKEMIESLATYMSKEDMKKVAHALKYASEYGSTCKHYDGTYFFSHILRTELILAELHSDATTIITELVWWLPSYGEGVERTQLLEEFGEDVYNISISLEKTSTLKLKDDLEKSALSLRKILVGLSTDVRVIIIKLANRLDNLRYVYTEPSEIQKQKCIETENVLIPIAHRLGINYIKSELEDLCLKYMKPDAYQEILDKLDASYDELNGYIDTMKSELSEMMVETGIKFRIKGRAKSVHSLYEKLAKGKRWKDIYDILALRIIVQETSECYLAIGLIHSKYRPIPKRFKDYIARPKENMYQSLHTGVIGPEGKVFEIQIRTEEMDEIAECGIASHWSYKEHGAKVIQDLMEQKLELFRNAMEVTNEEEDAEDEFKEAFTSEMVYVYTPKGDVVELPIDATPVDLAYKIHSHIGDTMIGAIVNDEIVPLDYKLQNDDIVKIKTNESSIPNKEWLKFVKTTQARNRIKAYYSKQDRIEYIARGEELLLKELKRRKLPINETLSQDNINKLLKDLNVKDLEEIKLSIGSLKYTAKYVVNLITEDKPAGADAVIDKISAAPVNAKEDNYKNDIIVKGCDNVLVTIANCCKPVFGDKIVGYITKGNGITVHKESCSNLRDMDARFIDVEWNSKSNRDYSARVTIRTRNIGNNILDIVTKASQRNINIESIITKNRGEEIDYEVMVRVPNIDVLKLFMIDVEGLEFVTSVERELK